MMRAAQIFAETWPGPDSPDALVTLGKLNKSQGSGLYGCGQGDRGLWENAWPVMREVANRMVEWRQVQTCSEAS